MKIEKKYQQDGLKKTIGDIDQIVIVYDKMAEMLIKIYITAREDVEILKHQGHEQEATDLLFQAEFFANNVKEVLTAAGIVITE